MLSLDDDDVEVVIDEKLPVNSKTVKEGKNQQNESKNPILEVANLLVTMLFAHAARTKRAISLPGRAKPNAERLLEVTDGRIDEIKTGEDLKKVLVDPKQPSGNTTVVGFILSIYKNMTIIPATGDLKVQEFPGKVIKSVVANQTRHFKLASNTP